jgi:ParB family transcriptional regulator, chromosome partitioning protein
MSAGNEKHRPAEPPAKAPRLGRGLSALMGVHAAPIKVEIPTDPSSVAPTPRATPLSRQPTSSTAAQEVRPITIVEVPEAESTSSLSDLMSLPVEQLAPNSRQPRRDIATSDLASLAASIKSAGVMQPVIVRPARTRKSGGGVAFEIVAGERRWRAAQLAGLSHIPAIVRDLTDEQAAEWALVENVQREDLNAMDRALALKALCDTFGASHAELGERIGLDRSTIANLIRLTELEHEIAELISKGTLGAGHGKALLAAPSGPSRVRLAREAAQRSYSVRRVEFEAKRLASGATVPETTASKLPSPREAVLRDIEKRIAQALGTKVQIRTDPTGKRGQITLDFYDLDQFDGLLSRLGVSGS